MCHPSYCQSSQPGAGKIYNTKNTKISSLRIIYNRPQSLNIATKAPIGDLYIYIDIDIVLGAFGGADGCGEVHRQPALDQRSQV